jgi:hypothetical protein
MEDFIATTATAHWQVRCGTSWRKHSKHGQSFVLALLQWVRLTIAEPASARSRRQQSRRHDDPRGEINHRSAAMCLEGAVGASRHEPGTYVFIGD